MKKFFSVTILVLITACSNLLFSWDSSAAKFYPMAIGNTWSYHHVNYAQFTCIPYTSNDYIVRIDSFVSRSNGKWYYKFSDGILKRIDSASMNVYRYLSNNECLADSLFARKNDTVKICFYNPYPIVTDTIHVIFANTDRRKLRFQQPLIGVFYRELVEGLGYFYEIQCEGGGFHRTLNGCIINGIQYGQIIGINKTSSEIPEEFSLYQNYPNPFNPVTKIRFDIPAVGAQYIEPVQLMVYDILGREIATLVNEKLSPGTYEVDFDGTNFPSGVYYYTLSAGEPSAPLRMTKKMVLIK